MCLHDADCKRQYYNKLQVFPSGNFSFCVIIIRFIAVVTVVANVIRLIKDYTKMVINIENLIIQIGVLICIESLDWIIRIKLVSKVYSMHVSRDPINFQYYKMTLEGTSSVFLLLIIFYIYLIEKRNIKNNVYVNDEKRNAYEKK